MARAKHRTNISNFTIEKNPRKISANRRHEPVSIPNLTHIQQNKKKKKETKSIFQKQTPAASTSQNNPSPCPSLQRESHQCEEHESSSRSLSPSAVKSLILQNTGDEGMSRAGIKIAGDYSGR